MPLTPSEVIAELDKLTPAQREALSPYEKQVLADANGDNVTNMGDVLFTISKFGTVTTPPDPLPIPPTPVPSTKTITYVGKAGATRTMTVAAPVGTAILSTPPGNGLDFSNRSDLRAGPANLGDLPAGKDVIHCGNLPSSSRILILSIVGTSTNYGLFISGYASDWEIDGGLIAQRTGANEHGLRGAPDRFLCQNLTVNTELASKRSLWYFGKSACFINDTFRGGACWFGALDTDMSGTIISGVRVLCRDCDFIQTRPDMPEAICVRSGVEELVLEDCFIEYTSRPLAIDSRRTGDVICRRIQVRAKGTTAWRPLTANDVGGDRTRLIIET